MTPTHSFFYGSDFGTMSHILMWLITMAALALFAFIILGQIFSPKEWLGGVLILTGIIVSEIRRPEKADPFKRKPASH